MASLSEKKLSSLEDKLSESEKEFLKNLLKKKFTSDDLDDIRRLYEKKLEPDDYSALLKASIKTIKIRVVKKSDESKVEVNMLDFNGNKIVRSYEFDCYSEFELIKMKKDKNETELKRDFEASFNRCSSEFLFIYNYLF